MRSSASGEPFLGVFVGDGPERGYGADDPRGSGRLDYRGARPHEEIARYMSAADVLLLPSRSEGLPTVLVEAGSLGLPVIASGVGGIPALLGDDRGTILREVSAAAIGEALAEFRDTPARGGSSRRTFQGVRPRGARCRRERGSPSRVLRPLALPSGVGRRAWQRDRPRPG